ncbi:L,D-transpeptidase [Nocardia sp. NPDC003693]
MGEPMQPRRFRPSAAIGSFAALVLLFSACSSATSSEIPPTAAPPPQVITIAPATGAEFVNPALPVRVGTTNGILGTVTMTDDTGRVHDGALTPDKTAWTPFEAPGYGRSYTISATGISVTGPTGPVTSTFTTLIPANQTRAQLKTSGGVLLAEGGVYGVGTIIRAHFDEDVLDRAAAEKHLVVTTEPKVEGAWHWLDNRLAHWRPRDYYAPGTKVGVSADLYGVELAPGLFGQENSRVGFTIGPAHVSIADDNTHMIDVFENGNLIRSMPTSMGMGGSTTVGGRTISFWTQPGIYTVMDQANPIIMDSSSYGLPVNSRLGYKETIGWATRVSTDGIYVHALDSTIWAQGNTDVSHGCLNLSTENARWFYEFALPGDVLEVRNTGGDPLDIWQGGDWGVPWEQWVAGSALR